MPRRIPSAIYKAESGLGNISNAGKPFETQGLFSLALIAAKCYAIQTERAKDGELPPIRQVFRGLKMPVSKIFSKKIKFLLKNA